MHSMRIVIVGAGQAGAALAEELRAIGHEGPIRLIGAEKTLPYQRPPLSKSFLAGKVDEERMILNPQEYYDELKIDLQLGHPVTAIDPKAKTVAVAGETLPYDQLALTLGAQPRRLPQAMGGGLPGVHVLRTLEDAAALAAAFAPGKRLLVIGGGFIGLEVAATAVQSGLTVTLVEQEQRILQRVVGSETAACFRDLHRHHGVDIREGTGLAQLSGTEQGLRAVLTDGTELSADLMLVGIGVVVPTDLAKAAGVVCENGICVDAFGQTSVPGIWAAGDCTVFDLNGQRARLESVENAADQAEVVAGNMLGQNSQYTPYPTFWTDQYDVKLQIAGVSAAHDRVVVREGDAEGRVSHWYYTRDQLIAVDVIKDPATFMIGRRLLHAGAHPPADLIAIRSTDLKELLPSTS